MARNSVICVLASIQIELCCDFRCQLSTFVNRNRVTIFYFIHDIGFKDRSRLAHNATVRNVLYYCILAGIAPLNVEIGGQALPTLSR